MNANSNNQIFIVDVGAGLSQPVNAALAGNVRRRIKKNQSQPVVDIIVVLVALPSLTILALLLEANTRGEWLANSQTRFTVLGLGFALAAVCLAICMYVTSRLGGKMWTGAIPSDGIGPSYSYYNPRTACNELTDLPPSYEVVMGFDIPPPSYHSIMIEPNMKDAAELEKCQKFMAIQHI